VDLISSPTVAEVAADFSTVTGVEKARRWWMIRGDRWVSLSCGSFEFFNLVKYLLGDLMKDVAAVDDRFNKVTVTGGMFIVNDLFGIGGAAVAI